MGKTVPSYRMAVEWEIDRWKGFRNALANEEEKQAFDEIMDMCRNLASAGSCACNPISLRLWQCRSFWLSKKRCDILRLNLVNCFGKKSVPKKIIQTSGQILRRAAEMKNYKALMKKI